MQPNDPVLVGIAAINQHDGDLDELGLMIEAVATAERDAGVDGLAGRADLIVVPRGTWRHADPGREIAARFGSSAHTVVGELGVLQTTLIARACSAIASGSVEVAIVVGGEAAASARKRGEATRPAPAAAADGAAPDEVLSPHGELISPLEIARQFWTPAHQYALIESTLGRTPAELDRSWAAWSSVAAGNPSAWRRDEVEAEALSWGSTTNPPVAFPYGRRHCSQMNVDQAGAMLFVSASLAASLDIARDRWVFPWAIVESNEMIALPRRERLDRSPGFAAVRDALVDQVGVAPADAELVDLYSCFPAAVEIQRREFGLGDERSLTLTGGMSFAGGPFNNFVFQSTIRAASLLRDGAGTSALVTAISGMITKQGAGWWSTSPAPDGFRAIDISGTVAATAGRAPLVDDPDAASGPATVVAATVVAGGDGPTAWALAELADGRRTLVSSSDAAVAQAWIERSPIGAPIEVEGATFVA